MSTTQRLSPMDSLKGLAILMVVLGHIFNFGVKETEGVLLFRFLSIVQLPIFVFVSGYFTSRPLVAPWQFTTFCKYWQSKATRLLLPLLIIPFVFRAFASGWRLDWPTYEILLGEYWFTLALFLVFVVFYGLKLVAQWLALPFAREKREMVEIVALIGGVLLVELVCRQCELSSQVLMCQMNNIHWLYKYLVLGHIIGRLPHLQSFIKRPEVSAVSALTLAVSFYFALTGNFTYSGGGVKYS